jgi:hypothetical protein
MISELGIAFNKLHYYWVLHVTCMNPDPVIPLPISWFSYPSVFLEKYECDEYGDLMFIGWSEIVLLATDPDCQAKLV